MYAGFRTDSRLKTTFSRPLPLFAILLDVRGVSSFREASHKTCHPEPRHLRFSHSDFIMTVVLK
jgi:hypothetical protein